MILLAGEGVPSGSVDNAVGSGVVAKIGPGVDGMPRVVGNVVGSAVVNIGAGVEGMPSAVDNVVGSVVVVKIGAVVEGIRGPGVGAGSGVMETGARVEGVSSVDNAVGSGVAVKIGAGVEVVSTSVDDCRVVEESVGVSEASGAVSEVSEAQPQRPVEM